MSLKITKLSSVQLGLKSLSSIYFRAAHQAVESVLMEMVNWTKENHESLGGWNNDSHNLESSISHKMQPLNTSSGKIVGHIYAGMEYAVNVEFMENKWVLSGSINEFFPKAKEMIADRIKRAL